MRRPVSSRTLLLLALTPIACSLLTSTAELTSDVGPADGGPATIDGSPLRETGAPEDGGAGTETSSDGNLADAGPIAPVADVVADAGLQPRLVAMNTQYVYAIGAAERVLRVRRSDHLVEALSSPTQGYNGAPVSYTDLAANEALLFLSGNEGSSCGVPALLWKASVLDGGAFTEVGGGTCKRMTAVAGDALHLVGGVVNPTTGTVQVIFHPLTGGPNRTIPAGVAEVTALSAQGTEIFFASAPDAIIARMVKDADAGTAWATAKGAPLDLAVDGSDVFWIESGGSVQKKPRSAPAGTAPQTLATRPAGLVALAQDPTRLFFTNAATGEVCAVGKSGGATRCITGQSEPYGIAADATAVYWVNRGNGQLVRAVWP